MDEESTRHEYAIGRKYANLRMTYLYNDKCVTSPKRIHSIFTCSKNSLDATFQNLLKYKTNVNQYITFNQKFALSKAN